MALKTSLRHDAPWGLGRISSLTGLADKNSTELAFIYNFDSSAGVSSDVYIIGACKELSVYQQKNDP